MHIESQASGIVVSQCFNHKLSATERREEDERYEINFAELLVHSMTGALTEATPSIVRGDERNVEILHNINQPHANTSVKTRMDTIPHVFISSKCSPRSKSGVKPTKVNCGISQNVFFRNFPASQSVDFQGAAIDTGAARSSIGLEQASSYAKMTGIKQTI